MAPTSPTFTRRLPALLLLGLLALLLLGQCAALLPGYSGPRTFDGWVASTDSVRQSPATLYLTLGLRNNLNQAVVVREVSGAVRFNGRTFPFVVPAALSGTLVVPIAEIKRAIMVPLPLQPDSLALLRAVLAGGGPAGSRLAVRWQATYSRQWRPAERLYASTSYSLPPLKRLR